MSNDLMDQLNNEQVDYEELYNEQLAENESLKAQLQAAQEDFMYKLAEHENSCKRTAKAAEERADKKTQVILASMIGILDDLERVMLAIKDENEDHAIGIAFIYKKFLRELRSFGCEQIKIEETTKFDPDVHEAISMEDSEAESGAIVACAQNGYMYNGKLMRAAKVRVAR